MNDEVQYTVVGEDGKEYGPMDLETLRDMVLDERVGAETRVWDSTTTDWHEAQQIEELGEFFPEAAEQAEIPVPPPLPAETAPPGTSSWALASMWCGIASLPTFFCGGWVLGALALVFGVVARNEIRQLSFEGSHLATAGIVCGAVSLGLSLLFGILFGPAFLEVLRAMLEEYRS
jgi:hypothetical protein